jgi:hypothetical protein
MTNNKGRMWLKIRGSWSITKKDEDREVIEGKHDQEEDHEDKNAN